MSQPPEGSTPVTPMWHRVVGSRGLQLLAGFVLLGWALGQWLEAAGGAEAWGERLGVLGPVFLVPAQSLAAFTPLLGEVIAVANAALYGFWGGSSISFAAWLLAAWVQYGIARRTARDFDFDATHARLPTWMQRFPIDHPLFLIGVRLPLGGPIVNTAAGAFGVSLWRHTWCAAIGIAPRAMFFSALASGLPG
ncbi:MAG: VTT domain-containing protein [Myxococcota bacterium]